jgi:hypothetical protein
LLGPYHVEIERIIGTPLNLNYVPCEVGALVPFSNEWRSWLKMAALNRNGIPVFGYRCWAGTRLSSGLSDW